MDDGVLSGLLAEAESALSSIRAQRAELDRRERVASEKVAHLRALIELETNPREVGERPPAAVSVSASGMRVEDVAAEILSEWGPTHYRELWEMVAQRGGAIASGNPAAVLLTRISRDERFQRAKGRGVYALAVATEMGSTRTPRKRRPRKAQRSKAGSASQITEA